MQQKPNLMFVCGTLFRRKKNEACSSGSDIYLEEIAARLAPHTNRISIISLSKTGLPKKSIISPQITVYRVSDKKIAEEIRRIHRQIHKNNTGWMLTQVLLQEVAIRTAKKMGIKTMSFQVDCDALPSMGSGKRLEPDKIVAISQNVADMIKHKIDKDAIVVYPEFAHRSDIFGDPSITQDHDILMFNPNSYKGGAIFFELAKRFPKIKFLAVQGWTDLKNKNGSFNKKLMKIMARSYGNINKVVIPEEPVAPLLPNLTIIRPQKKVGDIYKRAKVILVPSQWKEAFGQVVVEAGLNKKQVIASNNGGLPEAMKLAGIDERYRTQLLVNEYRDVNMWVKALEWYLANKNKLAIPQPQIPYFEISRILK